MPGSLNHIAFPKIVRHILESRLFFFFFSRKNIHARFVSSKNFFIAKFYTFCFVEETTPRLRIREVRPGWGRRVRSPDGRLAGVGEGLRLLVVRRPFLRASRRGSSARGGIPRCGLGDVPSLGRACRGRRLLN